ncbi:MAG: beta-eliminating lyase-related protein [Pseudomonadota bacterium]
MHPIVDFRSDLLVPPSAAVKAAMLEAMEASPEFDLRGDHYQRNLEEQVASLLGKQDALLFPTCTMANQTALAVHSRPGEVVIAEQNAHMITSEGGAPGGNSGVMVMGLPGSKGLPNYDRVEQLLLTPASVLTPRIGALFLENTHLRSGGSVLDYAGTTDLSKLAKHSGVAVHIDGARLFNAAIASGRTLVELTASSSSVSISLNKSLGAPFGAMLAGDSDFVAEALRVRQRFGGGIRPTSIVCAAALAALQSFDHIHDDHRRAKEIAQKLAQIPGVSACPEPQTNIVFVSLQSKLCVENIIEGLREVDILVLPFGSNKFRIVTHRGIDDMALEYASTTIEKVLTHLHRS